MPNPSKQDIQTLRAAYAAFNARDIDAAVALMSAGVQWPRAFKGGFVTGPEQVRAYWTEQWSEIDPHVEPLSFHGGPHGTILVEVQQTVRDLSGKVITDDKVCHHFTLKQGLISRMETWPLI